ncbi:hypothetical protein MHK_000040 [Candidatus Magnetomorum sp. HK-1]|nr:hypothetical protein MHK_000040 [Candidatus Magnetomorum sp. HK-1]
MLQGNELPIQMNESFQWDDKACIIECAGLCCKDRNYLMISFHDILMILKSPYAKRIGIESTCELFEDEISLLCIKNDPYFKIVIPYIVFWPIGAKMGTLPEHAPGNMCPFLKPLGMVYAYHKQKKPNTVHPLAMGCILMDHKPDICKLSPIGLLRGMETGMLSFCYVKPNEFCPACNSHKKINLKTYLNSLSGVNIGSESLFHEVVMSHFKRVKSGYNQSSFNQVLKQIYNIDRLLLDNNYDIQNRPSYKQLISILYEAANGKFDLWETFLNHLNKGNLNEFLHDEDNH